MKTVLKVIIGVFVALVLIVILFAVLLGGAANEVSKSIDKEHAKDAEYAMSTKEFKSVDTSTNMTYKQFVEQYGKPDPERTQKQSVDGTNFLTVYYNIEGGEFLDSFQFSFTNGVLDGKSQF